MNPQHPGFLRSHNPPQLACLGVSNFPSSRSEFRRADRRISRYEVRLTSRLEIDRHMIGAGLRNDYIEAVNNDSQVRFWHVATIKTK
jgi:hypothetical protein